MKKFKPKRLPKNSMLHHPFNPPSDYPSVQHEIQALDVYIRVEGIEGRIRIPAMGPFMVTERFDQGLSKTVVEMSMTRDMAKSVVWQFDNYLRGMNIASHNPQTGP